jgi:hypothetical protein
MLPKSHFAFPCLIIAALAVTACGQGVKKSLGLERNVPDEFAVVERAPLTLPPNYQLVAPTPGASRPQEVSPTNTARGLVLRSEPSAPKAVSGLSGAENALLNKAGFTEANPNIRTQLSGDKNVNEDPNRPVIEKIGLRGNDDITKGKALDAVEEAKRLNEKNIKAPQPVLPSKTKK